MWDRGENSRDVGQRGKQQGCRVEGKTAGMGDRGGKQQGWGTEGKTAGMWDRGENSRDVG